MGPGVDLHGGNPAREVSESLEEDFASAEANAFPVVALGGVDEQAIDAYARELSGVDGITRVDALTGRYADASC